MEKIIQKTAEYVKEYFKNDTSGHDWWHTYRVWQTAKKINKKEKSDQFVVEMAALLHDLDDFKFGDGNKTEKWLEQLELTEEVSQKIARAARSVSFKGACVDTKPATIEGMIVQDADRLDALGAIGIARTFAYGGHNNRQIYNPEEEAILHNNFESYKNCKSSSLNHFYEKLLLLRDKINTETARRIAEKRHRFLEEYLKQFMAEWNSEDF